MGRRQPVDSRRRSAVSYKYNGLGQRTEQTVAGVTTEYALDGSAGLPEVIAATASGATTQYVQVQGQILAEYDSGAGATSCRITWVRSARKRMTWAR